MGSVQPCQAERNTGKESRDFHGVQPSHRPEYEPSHLRGEAEISVIASDTDLEAPGTCRHCEAAACRSGREPPSGREVASSPPPEVLQSSRSPHGGTPGFHLTEEHQQQLRLLDQLRLSLDVRGDGSVTTEEMERAIQLLGRLSKDKAANAAHVPYKHMPQCVQEVLQGFDPRGAGVVSAKELADAADARRKLAQDAGLFRRILCLVVLAVLLLLLGNFGLSILAMKITQEIRVGDDGTLLAAAGQEAKVRSSEIQVLADGTLTCPDGACNALSVAAAEVRRPLTSRLPDPAFRELKFLTVADTRGHVAKISISGFQRLFARTSRCGSLVLLYSAQGQMTLDDSLVSADPTLREFLTNAGMKSLFASSGNGSSSFGSALDVGSAVEGFFNMLDLPSLNSTCAPVPLPPPNELSQQYRAEVRIRQHHTSPTEIYSKYFTDGTGAPLLLPGVEMEAAQAYKTWTQDVLRSSVVSARMSHFAMHPLQRAVEVEREGLRLQMEAKGPMGFFCEVDETPLKPARARGLESPDLSFLGLVLEDGVVLRHWQLNLTDASAETADGSMVLGMMEAGMFPNILDYFDVDTDPSGAFAPGNPYRLHMYSTASGIVFDRREDFLSVTPLASDLTLLGVFDAFGVTKMDTACQMGRQLTASSPFFSAASQLLTEVSVLDVVKSSLAVEDFAIPPEIHPWSELPSAVLYTYDSFLTTDPPGSLSLEALRAKRGRYWQYLFTHSANQAFLATQRSLEGGGNPPNSTGSARRLAGEEWLFRGSVLDNAVELELAQGAAKLIDMEVWYCHIDDPKLTPVAGCQTGALGPGEVFKIGVKASGEEMLLQHPRLPGEFSGSVDFDLATNQALTGALRYDVTLAPHAEFSPGLIFLSTEVTADLVDHRLHGQFLSSLRGQASSAANMRVAGADVSLRVALKARRPWRTNYQLWTMYMALHVTGWMGIEGFEDDYLILARDLSLRP